MLAKCLETQRDFDFGCEASGWTRQSIVRYHAAVALNRFGEEAKSAIPELINGIGDSSFEQLAQGRHLALRQIARDPKKGPDARHPRLARPPGGRRRTRRRCCRLEAILSLGFMGRPSDPEVYKHVEATLTLRHRPRQAHCHLALVSRWCSATLRKSNSTSSQPTPAMPTLRTRIHACAALGSIGTKARTHVGVLIDLLSDKDNDVYAAACTGIMSMGEPGDKATEALHGYDDVKLPAEPKLRRRCQRSGTLRHRQSSARASPRRAGTA